MARIIKSKIKTLPHKNSKKHGSIAATKRNRKIKQLIFSVLGIYVIGGALFGMMFFNSTKNSNVDASDSLARITSSIRFVEEKEYKLGDEVKIALTLQNTSINESLNDISLTLLSTKEMVSWENAISNSSNKNSDLKIIGNTLKLPVLSAGERIQYEIKGVLRDNSSDFLTILGKIKYVNSLGEYSYDTNRIFTELDPNGLGYKELYELKISKEIYNPEEEIQISLTLPEKKEEEVKKNGKIFISNKTSSEVVYSQDCLFESINECKLSVNDLPAGKYTAMFIEDEKGHFSQIQEFLVSGSQVENELKPNEQAEMIKPFKGASINGKYPVIVERVISRNESLNSPACEFQILKGEEIINQISAGINSDRSCKTMITAEQLDNTDQTGIYTVRLKNSNLTTDFSFVPVNTSLELISKTTAPKKGEALSLEVKRVVDEQNNPVESEALTLFVYHQNSGKFETINNSSGEPFMVKDGKFETVIPASYFQDSGQYMIWTRLQNGRLSDFLSLIFSNSELGLARSGVQIEDYSDLRVDKDQIFTLESITDRDGNIVESGDCSGDVYGVGNTTEPIKLAGEIISGKCQITLTQGRVSKPGPILVNFNTSSSNNLPQSRVLQIKNGKATNFGEFNFEFEPIRKKYANSLIIGPVVDKYNNLADSFDLNLVFKNLKNNTKKEMNNINISKGYAKINIPASFLDEDEFQLQLVDKEGNILLERKILTQENTEKLILPSIPDTLKSQEGLIAGISGIENPDITKCEIEFIKNKDEFLREEMFYSFDDKKCEINWDINKFRDTQRALIKFIIGDLTFSKVIDLSAGEPSNTFIVSPQVKFNSQEELQVSLFTSPILDKHGLPVKEGEITWEYNGKITKNKVQNGFGKLNLLASELESRDIKNQLDKRFLDLDLDVKADIISISKTNNISIFLAGFDIANIPESFQIKQGSNYVTEKDFRILAFDAASCEAILLNGIEQNVALKSHWQAGTCYVQTEGTTGNNQIVFSDNGFDIGEFEFWVGKTKQEVRWCKKDAKKCEHIQVLAPISSKITAIIHDEEKQWIFTGEELDNTVKLSQNGLNPLKEYLIEVSYKNLDGQEIKHYRQILGEKLISE